MRFTVFEDKELADKAVAAVQEEIKHVDGDNHEKGSTRVVERTV